MAAPHWPPFSMTAWRMGVPSDVAPFSMVLKSFGWQFVQPGFLGSTWLWWLKVTLPGLPSPDGNV